ncbi:MAG: hypothetical protein WAX04_11710, partial [Oscillospiraceae bacterium]
MKTRFGLLLIVFTLFATGCATVKQQSVTLSSDAISSKSGRIGVAMTALPKVDTQFPGADCLLCLAAASIANASLTNYTHTLTSEDLPKLKSQVANLLQKKGMEVLVIEENLNVGSFPDFGTKGTNVALKNFTPLKQKYNIDKLLVIDINGLGFIRTYASYIPTSDPKGIIRGAGYIINLSNNTYDWYLPLEVMKSADSVWDEPPKFPGLTNAY